MEGLRIQRQCYPRTTNRRHLGRATGRDDPQGRLVHGRAGIRFGAMTAMMRPTTSMMAMIHAPR